MEIDTINYSDELSQSLIVRAAKYEDEESSLFISELGWEDWMLEFCEDESSQEDGGELTEKDTNRIDEFLKDIFEKSREKEEEE